MSGPPVQAAGRTKSVGDFLSAIIALAPTGDAVSAVAAYFGFHAPVKARSRVGTTEGSPSVVETRASVGTGRPLRSRLVTLQPDSATGDSASPPTWLAATALPAARVIHAYSLPIEPLFKPNLTRALLTAAAALDRPIGEIDTAALVHEISRGKLLREVPRRIVRTLGRRTQLLIDAGKEMQPFAADIEALVDETIRYVGYSSLQLRWFRGNPLSGVQAADGEKLAPYQPPGAREAVLLVGDLDARAFRSRSEARGIADWLAFADATLRSGSVVTAIVPRPIEQIPSELRARMRVLAWDRSSGVRDLARGRTRADLVDRRTKNILVLREARHASAAALRLAERACIAARAEPQLLRALRLEVEPFLDVGAETDIYWSPLVDVHGGAGIVFRDDVLDGLRRRLRSSPDLLDTCWEITRRLHDKGPRALLYEEELTYLTLRGLEDPERIARAQAILRELVGGFRDQKLGLWGERAVLRLPRELFALDEARMLAVGVARSSENRGIWARLPSRADPGSYPWLGGVPLPLARMHVGLVEGGIAFGPSPFELTHELAVPARGPLEVELTWFGARQRQPHQWLLRLDRNTNTTLEIDSENIEIRPLGGTTSRIVGTSIPIESGHVRVFLSAVSAELGLEREAIQAALQSRGVTVVVQDEFRADTKSSLDRTYQTVRGADVVICVVGWTNGALPSSHEQFADALPSGFSRASFAQWELFFAQYERRRLFVYVAGNDRRSSRGGSIGRDDAELQRAFRKYVSEELAAQPFSTLEQLTEMVLEEGWPEPPPREQPDLDAEDVLIFISYANGDDLPPPGLRDEEGFVAYLYRTLSQKLRDLGATRAKIWLDRRRISDGDLFDGAIDEGLLKAQLLVVVLSSNWMDRPYCRKELDTFVELRRRAGVPNVQERLIVVGKDRVDRLDRPIELRGQEGFLFYARDEKGEVIPFYSRGKASDKFYDQRDALAEYLQRRVSQLSKRGAREKASPPERPIASPNGRTIYLAKPAGDMKEAYARLAFELQGKGFSVAPDPSQDLPSDMSAAGVIRDALGQAEASVHLVGERPGFAPEGLDPIVKVQLALARERTARNADQSERPFRRLIWAPRVLDLGEPRAGSAAERDPLVALARFDEQVFSDKISGDNLGKFVEYLFQYLVETAPRRAAKELRLRRFRIFLDYSEYDDEDYAMVLAQTLADSLRGSSVSIEIPVSGDHGPDARAFNSDLLVKCDGFILVWAKASEVWVRSEADKLNDWRALGRKEQFARRTLIIGPPLSRRKTALTALFKDGQFDQFVDLVESGVPTREILGDILSADWRGVSEGARVQADRRS